MRSALLVVSLCAGTVAFGQSGSTAASSFNLELTEPAFVQHSADTSSFHADLGGTNSELWKVFAMPGVRATQHGNNAQIDPGMIIRRPKSRIEVQPPGIPIAQKFYPGLQLLPIEESKARPQALTQ
jgi:hypothetical protein